MSAPIRITPAGRLGRAGFLAFGSHLTILVTSPGSTARAALAARRGITIFDVASGAARARAADRLAGDAARAAGCGVLVSLDGDIATAGPAPAGGWRIRIAPGGSAQADVMHLAGGGLATVRPGGNGTSGPGPVWKTVTVAGSSCGDARTAALATAARGETAVQWATSLGLAARLAGPDGSVVHTGRWSAEPIAA